MSYAIPDIAVCLCDNVADEMRIREAVRHCVYDLKYISANSLQDVRIQLNGLSPSIVFVDYTVTDGNARGVKEIEELRNNYPLAYFALVSSEVKSKEHFWVRGADFLTSTHIDAETVSEIYIKVLSDRERRRKIIRPFRMLSEELRRQVEEYQTVGVA